MGPTIREELASDLPALPARRSLTPDAICCSNYARHRKDHRVFAALLDQTRVGADHDSSTKEGFSLAHSFDGCR